MGSCEHGFDFDEAVGKLQSVACLRRPICLSWFGCWSADAESSNNSLIVKKENRKSVMQYNLEDKRVAMCFIFKVCPSEALGDSGPSAEPGDVLLDDDENV